MQYFDMISFKNMALWTRPETDVLEEYPHLPTHYFPSPPSTHIAPAQVDFTQSHHSDFQEIRRNLRFHATSRAYPFVPEIDRRNWPDHQQAERSPLLTRPRVNYVRPTRSEDWEPYQAVFGELYKTQRLKEVMETMERVYSFKATIRQYKTKIKEWGLDDKYIKTNEYIGIIKEKRRLERENPGHSYQFYLRGKHIEFSSIVRFENRATKRGLIRPEETLSDRESLGDELQYFVEGTPEERACITAPQFTPSPDLSL